MDTVYTVIKCLSSLPINARLATWNDLALAVVIALIPQAIIRTLRFVWQTGKVLSTKKLVWNCTEYSMNIFTCTVHTRVYAVVSLKKRAQTSLIGTDHVIFFRQNRVDRDPITFWEMATDPKCYAKGHRFRERRRLGQGTLDWEGRWLKRCVATWLSSKLVPLSAFGFLRGTQTHPEMIHSYRKDSNVWASIEHRWLENP